MARERDDIWEGIFQNNVIDVAFGIERPRPRNVMPGGMHILLPPPVRPNINHFDADVDDTTEDMREMNMRQSDIYDVEFARNLTRQRRPEHGDIPEVMRITPLDDDLTRIEILEGARQRMRGLIRDEDEGEDTESEEEHDERWW